MTKLIKIINLLSVCFVVFGVYAMTTHCDALAVIITVLASVLYVCTTINLKEAV